MFGLLSDLGHLPLSLVCVCYPCGFVLIAGVILMYGALLLFEGDFIHVVSITFSALILTELLMVGLTVRTWHWVMAVAQLLSLVIYIASLVFFKGYFGTTDVMSCDIVLLMVVFEVCRLL